MTAFAVAGLTIAAARAAPRKARVAPNGAWTILFGPSTTSLQSYHMYNRPGVAPRRWSIEDGVLHLRARTDENDKEDLVVTNRAYTNFELELEWKISVGGNSGILYKVVEDPKYEKPWFTGLEDQVLDNQRAEDNKVPSHLAGSIYDLVAAKKDVTRPVGEWNRVRIVVEGNRVDQWLNGHLEVSAVIGSKKWRRELSRSKYKHLPDFLRSRSGVVILQDHGDELWYRNVRIRELPRPD